MSDPLYEAVFWLFFNLFFLAVLSFYSMEEMAFVSFSKVRLHYYLNKGSKRAFWLNELLKHPSKLFGTTLIGVNIALFMGSECSRQLHQSLGINPDFAPLTQVPLVVIFGELAPMFAARRFAEHVSMLGIGLVYFSSKVLTPFIWIIGLISKLCNAMFSGHLAEPNLYITQEELQKMLEEQEEDKPQTTDAKEFNTISRNIFHLREKTAKEIMEPISQIPMLPSNATVEDATIFLKTHSKTFIPIFYKDRNHIIGVVLPRDLIRSVQTKKIRECAPPPWFVTQNTTVLELLKQFRKNNQSIAVILNNQGWALGIVHLDDVIEEIFGKSYFPQDFATLHKKYPFFIDKTFPASLTVGEFNELYTVVLSRKTHLSLGDFITEQLRHGPQEGESLYIEPFELTVKETSLTGIKTIKIQTKINA